MVFFWPFLIACVIGGVGVWLILARSERAMRLLGVILGLGALAFAFAQAARLGERMLADVAGDHPPILFYLFALIAIGSAVRLISHHRPVYSALYFVLVVLSSAAIFLYLEAEFMAFALVIVYAGAILITYLFVIMLAQQAPTADETEHVAPEYDRIASEPASAVFAGFLLLALLGQIIFNAPDALPARPSAASKRQALIEDVNQLDAKRRGLIELFRAGAADLPLGSRIAAIDAEGVSFRTPPADTVRVISYEEAGVDPERVEQLLPTNIENVGWALVHKFPVSLELAGVILLMAMFGAVVLSRKQIELSEDEKRMAAGMQRLTVEPGEASAPGETGGEGA